MPGFRFLAVSRQPLNEIMCLSSTPDLVDIYEAVATKPRRSIRRSRLNHRVNRPGRQVVQSIGGESFLELRAHPIAARLRDDPQILVRRSINIEI
ncbi:hypothetical protein NOJ28_27490 [Neorhizobium galegae]|uniref:hypothetical protein n=1 Tax=Neorhizobium galegae TaxID=399 RepID=UPI002104539B|nr:hypothetical protein [Neorhizobium galegae]MCQ1769272.1 hypothetical protein [Neorhizobium galegae]MCQ1848407.1 hypothetical protein [Neorhizobium galegae]